MKLSYYQSDSLKKLASERKLAETIIKKNIITYDKIIEKSYLLVKGFIFSKDLEKLNIETEGVFEHLKKYKFIDSNGIILFSLSDLTDLDKIKFGHKYKDIKKEIIRIVINCINRSKRIREILSSRLKYVFIDEYQDTRLFVHYIFKELLYQNKTQFYFIGDPLQSIFKFSYNLSQNKNEKPPDSYNNFPIIDLKNKVDNDEIKINRRSTESIIKFLNNFRELQQESKEKKIDYPIYFIKKIKFKEIMKDFYKLKEIHKIIKEENKIENLLLVKEWRAIEKNENNPIFDKYGINKISEKINRSALQEMSRCILGLTGLKKSEILEFSNILNFRKFCLKMLKKIKNKSFNNNNNRDNYILKMFRETLNIKIENSLIQNYDLTKSLDNISNIPMISNSKYNKKQKTIYSSIHSAKGLESTSVLVIAQTENQLKNWFETDISKLKITDDKHRLGYVAFSRARRFLCIACLKNISENLNKKINNLNINFN